MATLTVWRFPTTDGAAEAENTLLKLTRQQLIVLQDAAVAYRPQRGKKPRTQAKSMTAAAAPGGS
jgi:uncharacterized membrane protein